MNDESLLQIKEVCHIWELGGDAITFSQLIETPIKTNHALDKFAIFLVLDLSVPEKIWPTLDTVVSVSKRLACAYFVGKILDLTRFLQVKRI